MRAADLELDEFVLFRDGNIDLQGRRLVLHSSHAFGQFRRDIIDMLGPKNLKRIFLRFGFFWGQADAAAMREAFAWDDVREHIRAGVRMMNLEGLARTLVRQLEWNPETQAFRMEIEWQGSSEAEEHLLECGWATEPSCWKLIGYASGYVSYCLGKNMYFKETTCRAMGDNSCVAIGQDEASWGRELDGYREFFEAEDIIGTVERLAAELAERNRELDRRQSEFETMSRSMGPYFMKYRSRALQNVLQMADRVARFNTSVLVTGESGVGKEILARYIHERSPRAGERFVTVNCSALPETLLESELFGHHSGAFTGATRDRAGLFEEAINGTVFLDEIGDITPATQLKLLRVLQDKEIVRIGENEPRPVDVRIIAATNKDLMQAIADGSFRDDLLYRLRVVEIEIPPLRKRPEDIIPLARHIVKNLGQRLEMPNLRLDAQCIDYLQAYDWPGNVRELENALERAAVFSEEGIIKPGNLPPRIMSVDRPHFDNRDIVTLSLDAVEREHILRVLKAVSWNKSRAADVLGVSPSTLWRKVKQYGLEQV